MVQVCHRLADFACMEIGIQARLLSWLLLMVLPIAAASTILVHRVDTRLMEQVYAGLASTHRLESARIGASLNQYIEHAQSVAARHNLRLQLNRYSRITRFRNSPQNATFSHADITTSLNIEQLLRQIAISLKAANSPAGEIKIVTFDEKFSGKTRGFTDNATDSVLIARSRKARSHAFSSVFRNTDGEAIIGIAVPVFASADTNSGDAASGLLVTGIVIIQMKLEPIIDLLKIHEKLGKSSESMLAQLTPDGDAQLITPLRFKQNAAFNYIIEHEKASPMNQSLETSETRVLRLKDYRGIDTIMAVGSISNPGWGLSVKIDADEAFASVTEINLLNLLATVITVLIFLLSWWFMLRPMARRLCAVACAADRVAAGDYSGVLKDPVKDEIGSLSNSIDLLAHELDQDQKLRHEAERRLKYQAEHDSLTGLFNRKHMQDTISILDRNHSDEEQHSILFLDLDGFKAVNDLHGHHTGDEILVAVANAISRILPEGGSMGRWGGDEFLIILPDTNEESGGKIAMQISDRFDQTFLTSTGEQHLGCSIGIATSDASAPLTSCIELADARMYDVKQSRKVHSEQSYYACSLVRQSLKNNRTSIWYTPIFAESRGEETKLIGTEAWLHLHDANGEQISTQDYLSQSQGEDISARLDLEVLSYVCSDLQHWRQRGLVNDAFCVYINISSDSIKAGSFAEALQNRLESHALPAQSIVLEFSAGIKHINPDVLRTLKRIGIQLSIDDVGLHDMNLLDLVTLSPDVIKLNCIEGLFKTQANDHTDKLKQKQLVFDNFIKTCRDLHIHCIAEEVDTRDKIDKAQALGMNAFQASPASASGLSSNEFINILEQSKSKSGTPNNMPYRLAG